MNTKYEQSWLDIGSFIKEENNKQKKRSIDKEFNLRKFILNKDIGSLQLLLKKISPNYKDMFTALRDSSPEILDILLKENKKNISYSISPERTKDFYTILDEDDNINIKEKLEYLKVFIKNDIRPTVNYIDNHICKLNNNLIGYSDINAWFFTHGIFENTKILKNNNINSKERKRLLILGASLLSKKDTDLKLFLHGLEKKYPSDYKFLTGKFGSTCIWIQLLQNRTIIDENILNFIKNKITPINHFKNFTEKQKNTLRDYLTENKHTLNFNSNYPQSWPAFVLFNNHEEAFKLFIKSKQFEEDLIDDIYGHEEQFLYQDIPIAKYVIKSIKKHGLNNFYRRKKGNNKNGFFMFFDHLYRSNNYHVKINKTVLDFIKKHVNIILNEKDKNNERCFDFIKKTGLSGNTVTVKNKELSFQQFEALLLKFKLEKELKVDTTKKATHKIKKKF